MELGEDFDKFVFYSDVLVLVVIIFVSKFIEIVYELILVFMISLIVKGNIGFVVKKFFVESGLNVL